MAAVAKVHHALADGMASAELLDLFHDTEPSADAAPARTVVAAGARPVAGVASCCTRCATSLRLLVRGLPRAARRQPGGQAAEERSRAWRPVGDAAEGRSRRRRSRSTGSSRPTASSRSRPSSLDDVKHGAAPRSTARSTTCSSPRSAGGLRRYLQDATSCRTRRSSAASRSRPAPRTRSGTWGNRLGEDLRAPPHRHRRSRRAAHAPSRRPPRRSKDEFERHAWCAPRELDRGDAGADAAVDRAHVRPRQAHRRPVVGEPRRVQRARSTTAAVRRRSRRSAPFYSIGPHQRSASASTSRSGATSTRLNYCLHRLPGGDARPVGSHRPHPRRTRGADEGRGEQAGGDFVSSAPYTSIAYRTDGRVARITLNRPDRLNAIDDDMPRRDPARGRGGERGPCGPRDRRRRRGAGVLCRLRPEALRRARRRPTRRPLGPRCRGTRWRTTGSCAGNTDDFLSLWRSYKPTIAKVQGYAVAGGSDIALSCDLVVMAEDAADRLHAGAGLGLSHHRHVGVPPRRRAGEAPAVHRRHDRRAHRRRHGDSLPRRCPRTSSTRRSRRWPSGSPVSRATS